MERVGENPMRSDAEVYTRAAQRMKLHKTTQIVFECFVVLSLIHHLYPFVRDILWESNFQVLVVSILRPPWIPSDDWYLSLLLLFIYSLVSFIYLMPWFRSNKWYLYWLLVAALYHLPPQPMDTVMRFDVSLFLTTFASSILRFLVLLSIFEGCRYLLTRETPEWPDILYIFKHSAVVSIIHCAFTWELNDHFSKWLPEHPQCQEYEVYMSWPVFIYLSILVWCLRTEVKYKGHRKPNFLDMVPWYSGTSADLYKTVFDLLVSGKIFLGRFDLRMLLGGMNQVQDGAQQENLLYDFSNINEELWFDFMADTGDGGNSTYTVTRLLAEPHICCDSGRILKRGDVLLIGGDLAYPNPSKDNYERRLFRPFEYALQPPVYRDEEAHPAAPQCFVIPGNHDWFDGLHTFMKYMCYNRWLGGWIMPQRTTYFALKLPQKWWIFGLDLALDGDMDTYQYLFFAKLASDTIGNNESVIVMTHQPDWLLDWYESGGIGRTNLSYLICTILKERCKLRIAGDIHHYMRHSIVGSNGGSDPSWSVYAKHLLVNGCGGAFAHPTHVFGDFEESHGVSYKCRAAYPEKEISKKLALGNILKFREVNSQFDFVGGIIYYILAYSMFPQCKLDQVFQVDSMSGLLWTFVCTLWSAFIYMLQHSYVSLGGAMLLVIVAIAFVPSKVSWKTRVVIGILHASAHLTAALILMLVLELGVEALVRHKLLASSGYHSLYRWYESAESRHFPLPNGTGASIEHWTFGLYRASIKNLMFVFDMPELMAVTRSNICKTKMVSLSRWDTNLYYGSVFLYFFLLSTPAVSYVFGIYLCICVNWFNLHYDHGFSSLRIADYKAFTRFHIKPNGDLEVFTLAVDEVPQEWQPDPDWKLEKKINLGRLSHNRWFPSIWRAAAPYKDPLKTVRIIDQFVIRREDSPSTSETEEST